MTIIIEQCFNFRIINFDSLNRIGIKSFIDFDSDSSRFDFHIKSIIQIHLSIGTEIELLIDDFNSL